MHMRFLSRLRRIRRAMAEGTRKRTFIAWGTSWTREEMEQAVAERPNLTTHFKVNPAYMPQPPPAALKKE
jgi:hypothetical protein